MNYVQLGKQIHDIFYSIEDMSVIPWWDADEAYFQDNLRYNDDMINHISTYLKEHSEHHQVYQEFMDFLNEKDEDDILNLINIIFYGFQEEEENANNDVEPPEFIIEEEEDFFDHEVLTPEILEKQQNTYVRHFSSSFNISNDVAYLLLEKYKWNTEVLSNKLVENLNKCLKEIGLSEEQRNCSLSLHEVKKEFTCDVCYDDFDEGLALICGHTAKNAGKNILQIKLHKG